jgi:pentatricopeptide repeat protein
MGIFDFLKETSPKTKLPSRYYQGNKTWVEGSNRIRKEPLEAELYLLASYEINQNNPIDLHFTYSNFINLYFKYRKTDPEALQKCIFFCMKDIELFPEFKEAYINDLKKRHDSFSPKEIFKPVMPGISSFSTLIRIYREQGRYEDAIEICKLDVFYGANFGSDQVLAALEKNPAVKKIVIHINEKN